MRSVVIPALLLSALAGLAVVPMASAAPPAPPCNGFVHIDEDVGPVHASITPGQCYEFIVDPFSCPLGPKDETSRSVVVGGVLVSVTLYTCSTPESTSPAAPPCTCPPPQCHQIFTVGPLAEVVSITVTSSCNVIISVLPHLIACADPLDGQKVVTLGRVSIVLPCGEIGPCEAPLECYPAAQPRFPPVCIERTITQGAVEAHVGQCGAYYVEVVDCSSGGAQNVYFYEDFETNGRVYVLAHYCLPHSPPPSLDAAAAPPSPCGAAEARCPAPVPPCSGLSSGPVAVAGPSLSAAAAPINASYKVHPNCRVEAWVKADVMDCLWGEGYNPSDYGPVRVWTWGCRPPTTFESASMADPFPTCVRECSPVPDPACELQDATPSDLPATTLDPQSAVWGSDCDVDLSTACLGGSNDSTDVRALFLDVSLARCDTPDWS